MKMCPKRGCKMFTMKFVLIIFFISIALAQPPPAQMPWREFPVAPQQPPPNVGPGSIGSQNPTNAGPPNFGAVPQPLTGGPGPIFPQNIGRLNPTFSGPPLNLPQSTPNMSHGLPTPPPLPPHIQHLLSPPSLPPKSTLSTSTPLPWRNFTIAHSPTSLSHLNSTRSNTTHHPRPSTRPHQWNTSRSNFASFFKNVSKHGDPSFLKRANVTKYPRWNTTTPKPVTTTTRPATTTTEAPLPRGPIINSVPFGNYEQTCPDNLPVRAFSYKQIDNGTASDYALKALCFPKVTFENGSALNLSTAECDYRKAFSINDDAVSNNDTNFMCSSGEYINGAQSEYFEGSRLLRIRCCKTPLLHLSLDYGCQDLQPEQTNTLLRSKKSPKCPIEVLTGVRFGLDKQNTAIRYCGLAVKDSTYSAVCYYERRDEIDRLRNFSMPRTPTPFFRSLFIKSQPVPEAERVQQGNWSVVNRTFIFNCSNYESIDSVEVRRSGDDFEYRFTCKPVAPKLTSRVFTSMVDFLPMSKIVDDDLACDYQSDYSMCGVASYLTQPDLDNTRDRNYAFLCCQLPNAQFFKKIGLDIQNTTFDQKGRASISRPGFFLEKLHILYKKGSKAPPILVTGWSAYNITKEPVLRRPKISSGATCSSNGYVAMGFVALVYYGKFYAVLF